MRWKFEIIKINKKGNKFVVAGGVAANKGIKNKLTKSNNLKKLEINKKFGSKIVEVKSYEKY